MARSSDIASILEIGSVNCIANPSLEVDTSSWGGTGSGSTFTRTTADHYTGSACGAMTTSGDSQWVEALLARYIPGKEYTFSVYVKGTAGETIHLNIYTGSVDDSGSAFTFTGEWQRLNRTITLASSGEPKLQIRRFSGDSTHSIYIDAAMVTRGDTLLTYFDGSFGTGCGWYGTAHNSASYRKSRALA